jgi:type IV secretory pathway VirB2 component (pilin)
MQSPHRNLVILLTLAAAVVLLWMPDLAHASAAGGGGLPYESALDKIQKSATGPVAFVLSLVGIVVAGGTLIFGGDLSGFFRSMVVLVLVIGIMVSASNVLQTLFGRGAHVELESPWPAYVLADARGGSAPWA